MTKLAGPTLGVILYEGTGSLPIPEADRVAMLRALLEQGYAVSSAPSGASAASSTSADVLVLGRFAETSPPPAATGGGARVFYRSLEGSEPAAVPALVDAVRREADLPQPGGWKPWFPVIDYSRCTNCMQCLSFCLFDVYAVSPEGKIRVQNQSNCKTDCPACSRVCPEVAILFPKYRQGPIHGGEIDADDLRREAMKVDISALLGGDIYQQLRDRSARAKSRFSQERDEDRALKERLRCLRVLGEKMDIPPEVLQSLPNPDEIRARAEAAMERARDARERSDEDRA